MENNERLFYRQRARFNKLVAGGHEDTAEGAALFYFLKRTGFNGLCRFNSRGEFSVPFGRYARIGYTHDFTAYKDVFQDWKFTDADFETVKLARSDFVYADPPYDVEFTTYSKGGFSWDDQVRTAKWFAHHKGPVILVNQATPRICDLRIRLSEFALGTRVFLWALDRSGDWARALTNGRVPPFVFLPVALPICVL